MQKISCHVQAARRGAAQATPQQANSDCIVQEAAQATPEQEQGDSLEVVLVVRQLPDCFTRDHSLAADCDPVNFIQCSLLSAFGPCPAPPSTALMSAIAPAVLQQPQMAPVASFQLLQHCSLNPLVPLPAGGKHLRDMALGVHTINLNHPLSTESVGVLCPRKSPWYQMLHPALFSAVLGSCSAPHPMYHRERCLKLAAGHLQWC